MSRGKVTTGYNPQTKDHLHLNAGAIFKNFEVGVDTYESARASGKLIGATQGGNEFKAVAEVRQIEIDGLPGRAKGAEVIDSWEVSQMANFVETTPDIITMALGAATIDSDTNGTYHIIKGKNNIEDEDYIDNITYIGTISGSERPVIIQTLNALSTDGLDIKTEDKKEGVIAATFYGHYEDDGSGNIDSPPYIIYYPKGDNVAKPVASVKGGTYTSGKSVTLSCADSGATIRYTTNGFEPDGSSDEYTTAISISQNTILKAKAFKSGKADSPTLTETYIIKSGS